MPFVPLLLLLACSADKPDDGGTGGGMTGDGGGSDGGGSDGGVTDGGATDGGVTDGGDTDDGGGETDGGGDTGSATACEGVDCDDGDPCTVDTCDEGTGTCSHAAWSGEPLDLFDMDLLTDESTLDVEVLGTSTVWEGLVPVQVQELRYTSYEYSDCVLEEVRLEAFLAIPSGVSGSSPAPGLAVAHGLGGYATEGAASNPAGELSVVALAWSGPGQGASEGVGSGADHLFDTVPFPGDSWFWGHSVAGIRALTLLASLEQVDASHLALTGYSGGALISYIVNGVDDRLDAIVPVSATGYLDRAIAATPTPGWEYDLLQSMDPPRDETSAEWLAFDAWLDPKHYLATAHGVPLVIDGAQDEFFPLTSLVPTFEALQVAQPDARLLAVPNWDHGWYAYFNGDEAEALANASLAFWVRGRLGLDGDVAAAPPQPSFYGISAWTCLLDGWYPYACTAVVLDTGTTSYDVASARFHWSSDSATVFQTWELQDLGDGLWGAEVGTLDWTVYNDSNLAYFGEVTYQDGLFGEAVTVTTVPHLYDGFSPVILPSEL